MSKSPIKFFIPGAGMMSGLMGNNQMLANNTNATAIAAARARNASRNIQPQGSGLVGAIGAGLNSSGAGGGSNIGLGGRPQVINDAGFNPGTQNIMDGIFGSVNARQNSLGASGIYALKEHLSPVKNEDNEDDGVWAPGEAKKLFDKMKYITDANIKKGAGAYIEVNNPAGDSYENPDYYDNLSSEELERKFPKSGEKNK